MPLLLLTSILVGDNLSFVVDGVSDRAVGVAKGDANGNPVAWRGASLGCAHIDGLCSDGKRQVVRSRLVNVNNAKDRDNWPLLECKNREQWWGPEIFPCQKNWAKQQSLHTSWTRAEEPHLSSLKLGNPDVHVLVEVPSSAR